jgi:hypothetical protein
MNPKTLVIVLLIAAVAWFVIIAPRMENTETVVPRASQK